MKIIQVSFCYYPDQVGGTEVYVESLSKYLTEAGVEIVVGAPADKNSSYKHEQISVKRFEISKKINDIKTDLYGEGDFLGAKNFGLILDQEKPDLVHLHAFTRGVSLLVIREAKKRGIPVVFTYHAPSVSCQRKSMMRWGRVVCEGKIDARLCAQCSLEGRGMPKMIAMATSLVPHFLGEALGGFGSFRGLTPLRMRSFMEKRKEVFYQMVQEVDRVVAVCNWAKKVLLINGVPETKITFSRQGLPSQQVLSIQPVNVKTSEKEGFKIVFLGRLDKIKGVHVLIQAIREESSLRLTLDIYSIDQGMAGSVSRKELQTLVLNDPRIRLFGAVPSNNIVETLRNYDALVVPSQCLETGPLVILEAFAAGIPVIGSNLGGIAELVKDGVDGVLVEPAHSIEAWRATLLNIARNVEGFLSLKSNIKPPKPMKDVASEMLLIYGRLLDEGSVRRLP